MNLKNETIHNPELEKGFFDAYASAASNLRTWLVAYGIGAPVLFLSNKDLWQALSKTDCSKCVGILFLAGVGFQILIAVINKYVMWGCYYGESKQDFKGKRLYRICDWISEQFWMDIICDIRSIVFFIVATFMVFQSLVRIEGR